MAGSLWTISRAGGFLEHLKNNAALIAERDHYKELSVRLAERAEAAERSATNQSLAAGGAEDYIETLARRIATVEERLTLFDKVVAYTRDLLAWAMKAEASLQAGGIKMPPMPKIPKDLIAALTESA